MISYIKGKVLEKYNNIVIVLTNDIGYEVHIHDRCFHQLGDIGNEIALLIHTNVREDAIELYGFSESIEKKVFLHLLSVSGVGAKSAMQILGKADANSIIQAIITQDLAFLMKLPTVGKKTASRLIVELSDKIAQEFNHNVIKITQNTSSEIKTVSQGVTDDLVDGLLGLGYSEKEILPIIKEIENLDYSVEELFKVALTSLAKGR